jgi:hypothetical protein
MALTLHSPPGFVNDLRVTDDNKKEWYVSICSRLLPEADDYPQEPRCQFVRADGKCISSHDASILRRHSCDRSERRDCDCHLDFFPEEGSSFFSLYQLPLSLACPLRSSSNIPMMKSAGRSRTLPGIIKTSILNGRCILGWLLENGTLPRESNILLFRSVARNDAGKITKIVFCNEGPEVCLST